MIEEEEDEDVLEKDISWKKIVKHIVVVALLILGVVIIYAGIGPDQITNFFMGFTLVCVATTILQFPQKDEDPYKQTLSILKCSKCDLTQVRHYEDGDFVYKIDGQCEKCDGNMIISKIYSVKLKRPTVPNEQEKVTMKSS
jgi:hypothetical protein